MAEGADPHVADMDAAPGGHAGTEGEQLGMAEVSTWFQWTACYGPRADDFSCIVCGLFSARRSLITLY
jgi:hypothetical protein